MATKEQTPIERIEIQSDAITMSSDWKFKPSKHPLNEKYPKNRGIAYWFSSLMMISNENPLAREHFPSITLLTTEMRRHINSRYYTIHPYSVFR